ncbi:MAG: glycerol kinase GlpK [Planctomycetota bacterium]
MGEHCILALDQGTTSSRAMVYDGAGRVRGVAQREFPQLYPRPGLVEHDAEAIWTTQREVAAAALAQAGLGDDDVAAVGITNQRETVVVWERATGRPIANAIVWQDRRTAADCERLRRDGVEPAVARTTGLLLDPYFSATKLRWLLDHVDGARAAAERGELCFGTIDSWLVFRLTGGAVHATDASNAARTMLCDLRSGDWDDEMLRLFAVPRAMLPEIRDCSGDLGVVAAGLPGAGARIAGCAGDQQAALFGQLCHSPGLAKNTYGTGCFLLLHTGAVPVASRNRLLTTVAWRIGGRTEYALEGGVFTGGAVVQWLRDELRVIADAAECDERAARVADSGGVYLVPGFAGLGAPHWDPYARGAVLGLTRGSNVDHLCRAALEGIALQVADLIECMQKDSGLPLTELRVDGGAARSAVLLQIQADLCGVPVVRPEDVETTARGAAMLAGLAVGFWDRAQLQATWREGARTAPGGDPARLDRLRGGWRRAVASARAFGAGAP